MRQQNLWLTTEYETLRRACKENPNISPADLTALFPRHTVKSVGMKRTELGLERLPGAPRQRWGWQAIADLLKEGPRTRQELADSIGCSRANVQQIMAAMKGQWHVSGYRPSTHFSVLTPVISLGPGEHAVMPKEKTHRKLATPFDVAIGKVRAPPHAVGRVYVHLTDEEVTL